MRPSIISELIDLAQEASQAVMDIYQNSNIQSELKHDMSPLTDADTTSHRILTAGLQKIIKNVPILSEEEQMPGWDERKNWNQYWLVDPLDGTKEFLKRNGEFTINVALIKEHRPILGVVWAPALNLGYYGSVHNKLACKYAQGTATQISPKTLSAQAPLSIIASRSHGEDETKKFLNFLQSEFLKVNSTNIGSSLKLCYLADGQADVYPRFTPTSEWDTAAAQAVLEAAGGTIIKPDGNILQYNTKESLLNPPFIGLGDPSFKWKEILNKYFSH